MARKASMWAKEAGEYYRKNVGKNGIESFTDVLKSSDFKKQYYAKNGKAGAKGSRKRGGDGDAVNATTAPVLNAPAATNAVATSSAPTNTTGGEIQVPMENVMGVMKTGGMKMKKSKRKMTKKKSLKNKKKRRMTKKYMGGDTKNDILAIINAQDAKIEDLKHNQELVDKLNTIGIKDMNIYDTIEQLRNAVDAVDAVEEQSQEVSKDANNIEIQNASTVSETKEEGEKEEDVQCYKRVFQKK